MRTSPVRWQLVAWLFLLSTVSYLDRVNMSIAQTMLGPEYGLTSSRLSLILSAFVLGYALFQAPAGRLADRLGPRRALLGAVLWWAIFSSLSAAVPTGSLAFVTFLVVR